MIEQDIKVGVDAVVFRYDRGELMVLLIQRKGEPFKGQWCFPGGFVEDGEDLEPAARRELKEETGLEVASLEQLRAFGDPSRDPRSRTITIAHFSVLEGEIPAVKGGDDAADARWYHVKELPQLGFDHAEIMEYALRRVEQTGNRN
jgi:8-oxo-dGTP diphosphatase